MLARLHSGRLFCALVLPGTLVAQLWVSRYDGPAASVDKASGVALDSAGNIYIAGFTTGAASGHDFITIKYNPAGETVWTRRYSGPGAADDEATGLALDPRGYVVVTGFTTGTSVDYLTIKYSGLTGETLWTRRVNGSGNGTDRPAGIAIDDAGYVYVTGSVRVGGHYEAGTVKYNQAGAQQWFTRVGTNLRDSASAARALALDRTGNVYVCGTIRDTLGFDDYLAARITTLGSVSWVRRYNGTGRGEDSATAVALDSSGNVYVTGMSTDDSAGTDIATVKFNNSGVQQWVACYDGTSHGSDGGVALAVDAAGSSWVAGYESGSYGSDYVTIKYDPAGSQLWTAGYDGSAHLDDMPIAVRLDPAGNSYVSGASRGTNGFDILTAKYSPSGSRVWTTRFDGPGHGEDRPAALMVPGPGVMYIAGATMATGDNMDCVTARYFDHDLALERLLEPADTVPPQPFVPRARVQNRGLLYETATVWMEIRSDGALIYSDSATATAVGPGSYRDVSFRVFPGNEGNYGVCCYTVLDVDQFGEDDTLVSPFACHWREVPVWTQRPNVPSGMSLKQVKDGGALCFGRFGDMRAAVFALKGNNTCEFYGFDVAADNWLTLESMPFAPERAKRVKKGAALAYSSYDTAVYALKGNGTFEFWRYDVVRDSWGQLRDVPAGTSNKKVKGGASLAFHHSSTGDFLYALKGGKQKEMWAYHIQGDTWLSRPDVPAGPRLRGMGDGSCLVTAGSMVYALKAVCNELYAYNTDADSWESKSMLPICGVAKGKVLAKYGSAMCTDGRTIYATKGGRCEFWAFSVAGDTWFELESLPRLPSGRPVKGGGALTYGNGLVWALKGNKTLEFWTYDPGRDLLGRAGPFRPGALVSGTDHIGGGAFSIFPNPVYDGHAALRCGRGDRHEAEVRVYDPSGRQVLERSFDPGGGVDLDLRMLASGVYVARLVVGGCPSQQKLVVRH